MARSKWYWAALALAPLAQAQVSELAEGRKFYEKECMACHGENTNARYRDPARALQLAVAPHANTTLTDTAAAPGANLQLAVVPPFGPNLRGIIGRPAGSIEGFHYSEPFLKNLKGMIWDEAALDRWMTSSQKWVQGATMYYSQKNAEIRWKIIVYLKAN
jgi:cytochrome c2